jgi:hypothetical protein
MKKGPPEKTNLLSRVVFCVFMFIAIVVEGRRRPVIYTNNVDIGPKRKRR